VSRTRDGARIPAPLLVPAALAVAFLVLPLIGLLVRAPWSSVGEQLTAPGVGQALRLSVVSATLATLLLLRDRWLGRAVP
jgi:molybdate transport system permease protein